MTGFRAIAVLGGGITGLTAAYRLGQLGHRVRVFEESPRLGGAIRTERSEGWLVEAGPNSLQLSGPETSEFLHDLDLEAEIVTPAPLAKNRYVARGKSLVPVPSSPGSLLFGSFFSFDAKIHILRELFFREGAGDTDVSVAELTRRHFGQEVLERVVQPFVSGVYAGDAEKLSARHAFPKLWDMQRSRGSLLRGQMAEAKARRSAGNPGAPKIISFRRGLQTLPHALAARMSSGVFALNARVEKIIPGRSFQVIWHNHAGPHTEIFDAVISALPATGLNRLVIGPGGERPLELLNDIPHPPVTSLFLGFKREQVSHRLDGFGALIPATEKRSVLGIIFSSSLFPDRAPPGHVAVTVMIGGALQPDLAACPATRLFDAIREDLRELIGVSGEPVFQRHTPWPKAIPQYVLGYGRYLNAMAECEKAWPGFFIGGQLRDGIALSSCIAAGEKLAARSVASINP